MDVDGTTATCRGAHAGGLLGGEDDVAVVGQHHDLLGAERLHRLEQLRGARVHGLAAVDDGVAAELAEQRLVALAGDHGDHDGAVGERAAGRCRRSSRALVCSCMSLISTSPMAPMLERLAEHEPGVVGVHVDLDHALRRRPRGRCRRWAPGRPRRPPVDGLARDEQARAVAVGRQLGGLVRRRRLRRAARRRCAARPAPSEIGDAGVHELGDAGGEAAEEHQQPVPAGVDDAGLLQRRQLLGGLLDGHPAGLLDGRPAACRGPACRARSAPPRPSRG